MVHIKGKTKRVDGGGVRGEERRDPRVSRACIGRNLWEGKRDGGGR
jgi:hypothetical protein